MTDAIGDQLLAHQEQISHLLAHAVEKHLSAVTAGAKGPEEAAALVMHHSIAAAFSSGLDMGATLGTVDIEAARRLREWFARVVSANDPKSIAQRDEFVNDWLRVLDVDPDGR